VDAGRDRATPAGGRGGEEEDAVFLNRSTRLKGFVRVCLFVSVFVWGGTT
jgi:hypothetical protein